MSELFSKEEFLDIFNENVEFARQSIAKIEAPQLDAMLIIETSEGDPVLVDMSMGFQEGFDRQESMFQVGRAMFDKKILPIFITLVSEVWYSDSPMLDPDTNEPLLRPSQDPLRREAIAITTMSVDMQCRMAAFDIIRDSNNNVHMGEDSLSRFDHFSEAADRDEADFKAPIMEAFFIGYASAMVQARQHEMPSEDVWKA
jgi:hypothetical protein